jgi:sigma-B regulation protein RsbU (phosphoserine phosphatase)
MGNGWTHNARILVVDDDEHNRKYYLQVLARSGYTADEAPSGEQAVEFIGQNNYHLVLSDLQMYRIGGLDVLKAAKDKNPHTQVVILTGYGSIPTAVKAMQKGAFDYMSKPVKKDAFLIRVEKALEQYDMQTRLQEQQSQIEEHQMRLSRDLELAKTVQDSLVPQKLDDDRIKIGFEYHPMNGIGGDFCSIHQDEHGRIFINMADVTGHGISAALIVNRVYNELNTILKKNPMPKDVLARMNDFFYDTFGHLGMYLTMVSVQLNFDENMMYFAGGAHPAILHYQPDLKKINTIESQNTIIGFEKSERLTIKQDSIRFQPGERFVIYTDGMIEAENSDKDEFGEQGLLDSWRAHAEKPIDRACSAIIHDVKTFSIGSRNERDDIMLLIFEIQ